MKDFFLTIYYFFVWRKYIKLNGYHLSKEENVALGRWKVIYPDGAISKPCFWDVACLRALEEPGSRVIYFGPNEEYIRRFPEFVSPNKEEKKANG